MAVASGCTAENTVDVVAASGHFLIQSVPVSGQFRFADGLVGMAVPQALASGDQRSCTPHDWPK